MQQVVSRDGTPIAYERSGSGPAIVLVGGGADDGAENAPLAAKLAERFSSYNYARRGRGQSGDTQPYAVEREIEDLGALISAAGGSAHVFGVSSGGGLALEAAAAGAPIDRVAVYEVPYNLDPGWPEQWRAYVDELETLLAAGRRGDAFARFMRLAGAPEEVIAAARESPLWPGLEALAPTLAYDAACLGDGRPPSARLAQIAQPALVLTGTARRDDGASWVLALDRAADAVAATIPRGERGVLEGQSHVADPDVLARALGRFFG